MRRAYPGRQAPATLPGAGMPHRRVVVEATELTAERDAEVFGQLIRSTEQIAAAYTDSELAVIRDFLERNRLVIAAHGDALRRNGAPQEAVS